MPSIQSEFALSTGTLGWIVSAYLLGNGGYLLLGGRATEPHRRRVFLASVAVFGIAGLLAALAPDATILIVFRLIKGVAAGFLVPAAFSLITNLWTKPQERGRAIGMFATAGAAGFIGGLVTEVSWRLAFALPIPFAIAVLIFAPRVIPQPAQASAREPLDTPGHSSSPSGLPSASPTEPASAGPTRCSWRYSSRAGASSRIRHPRTRDRQSAAAAGVFAPSRDRRKGASIAALWAAYNGFALLGTLAMQDTLEWSPLLTGHYGAPRGYRDHRAPSMGRLAGRIGAKPLVITGTILLTISYALFLRIDEHATFLTVFLPIMVVNGLGLACPFAPLNLIAADRVPPERQGLAASLPNTALQLGGAIIARSAVGLIGAFILPSRRRQHIPDDGLTSRQP
ncbi:MFS transporter [Plantibacter sp. Mn2098]|uniref:MFS transporter n=1 Tax=Plantibacter sp. Mn2098 TaxID=3395266 RepID=UPI003BBCBA8A